MLYCGRSMETGYLFGTKEADYGKEVKDADI